MVLNADDVRFDSGAAGFIDDTLQCFCSHVVDTAQAADVDDDLLRFGVIGEGGHEGFGQARREIEEMRAQVTPEEILFTKEALAPNA